MSLKLYFQFNLLATDYSIVMDIVNKNLTEGTDERTAVAAAPQSIKLVEPSTSQQPFVATQTVKKSSTNVPTAPLEPVEINKRTGTFLKFAFRMDSLVVNLFTKLDEGLATFGIYVLSLKGNMLVDGSLNTSALLYDIHLDDTRPLRENKITKFMAGKTTKMDQSVENRTPMIDITFYMKSDSLFAELRINSFDLIISMEFLMKVAAFLAVPPGNERVVVKSVQIQKPVTTAAEKTPTNVVADPVNNKQVTIIVSIGQPDIILLETLDHVTTNALFLNCELKLKYRQDGDQQNVQGEINNLNLHMSEFSYDRKESKKYYIVQPVQITLNGSTPDGQGFNVAVIISNINISISPLIIDLLNRILAQTTSAETEKVVPEIANDFSGLWIKKMYREQDYWFTQIEVAEEAAVTLTSVVVTSKNEVCNVDMPSLVINIETGYGNYTIPMLRYASRMTINLRNWSSQMALDGSLQLGMSYYNSFLALWEPLIEPNEIILASGMAKSVPWELNFGLSMVDHVDEITNGKAGAFKFFKNSSNLNLLQNLIRPQRCR